MGHYDKKSKKPEIFQDIIQPFLIDKTHLHGRFVRLNEVVNTILSRHDYPTHVSHLLGEQLILTALLSRALKDEGIITLQTKGDGPVKLMVTDITAKGELRGYAEVDKEKLTPQAQSLEALCGKGYMAITLDHGMGKQPYQGIVEISGTTLTECCLEYLHQSEQFKVHIKTSIAKTTEWQAGGLLVQRLPEDEHSHQIILPQPMGDNEPVAITAADDWERTILFVESLTRDEMLNPGLAPRDLLYRLFHDDGVWVYESAALKTGCRCTRARIEGILATMPPEELAHLTVDNKITVTCQFCNKDEVFER